MSRLARWFGLPCRCGHSAHRHASRFCELCGPERCRRYRGEWFS